MMISRMKMQSKSNINKNKNIKMEQKKVDKTGLKIDKKWWKGSFKWILFGLVGLFILIFFLRVAIWEDNYYREKEGSERVAVVKKEEKEELIEEKPTEEEVYEYTVAPEYPRYLTIDRLGVSKARIIPVGINENGQLGTPNNIFDVGWYDASGLPGGGKTLLIDGHNGGPNIHGVFKDLPEMVSGDEIVVERGDGKLFKYYVVENVTIGLDESDMYMATAMRSPESGRESVTLISCTGDWSDERDTYLSRQFVRAVLRQDTTQDESSESSDEEENSENEG